MAGASESSGGYPSDVAIYGVDAWDRMGFYSLAMGDVDDDGYDDLLIGASGASGGAGASLGF